MTYLIGLIIPAIVAFFIYQDAEKRGMNAIGWAIGSFLLLIVFVPLYFLMRKPLLVSPSGNGTLPPPAL